jgi:hypothetical protein
VNVKRVLSVLGFYLLSGVLVYASDRLVNFSTALATWVSLTYIARRAETHQKEQRRLDDD